jgi:hypothetical protein
MRKIDYIAENMIKFVVEMPRRMKLINKNIKLRNSFVDEIEEIKKLEKERVLNELFNEDNKIII